MRAAIFSRAAITLTGSAFDQTAQNRHLGAQHVAFGNVGQSLFRRSLHPGKCALQIDVADGDGNLRSGFALGFNQLQGARQHGIHRVDFDDDVGDCRP